MIKSETSNRGVEFRLFEHSSFSSACQILLTGPGILLLDTGVRRTSPSFLAFFELTTREYSSKATALQGSRDIVSSDQTMNGWIAYIREEFYSVPAVEAIYVAIEDNDVDVWLLIPDRDFALVRKLVDLEMKILESFATLERPLFLFEFHIIYRCGADETQFVPKRAIRLPR